MTDQHPHPLTDEICEDLWQWFPKYSCEIEDADVRKVMRAAADWQLEQVIEWGTKYLYPDQLLALTDAMRPQQQENN